MAQWVATVAASAGLVDALLAVTVISAAIETGCRAQRAICRYPAQPLARISSKKNDEFVARGVRSVPAQSKVLFARHFSAAVTASCPKYVDGD